MRNDTLITVQDFAKTREIKMSQFKEIWDRGGFYSDSNFANGDTALYLRIECDANCGGSLIKAGTNNIKQWFRPSFGFESVEVPSLPDDWEEIYICDAGYYAKYGRKGKLVARNNFDGTVQMFRI